MPDRASSSSCSSPRFRPSLPQHTSRPVACPRPPSLPAPRPSRPRVHFLFSRLLQPFTLRKAAAPTSTSRYGPTRDAPKPPLACRCGPSPGFPSGGPDPGHRRPGTEARGLLCSRVNPAHVGDTTWTRLSDGAPGSPGPTSGSAQPGSRPVWAAPGALVTRPSGLVLRAGRLRDGAKAVSLLGPGPNRPAAPPGCRPPPTPARGSAAQG